MPAPNAINLTSIPVIMNKVDRFIKNSLLCYPTLYKNRFEVLTDIVLGTNHIWMDGEIVYDCHIEECANLEVNGKLELQNEIDSIDQEGSTLSKFNLINQKKNLSDLTFLEDNIDHIASELHIDNGHDHYKFIQTILFKFSLGRKDFGNWILKFTENSLSSYRRGDDIPSVDDMDPEWRKALQQWVGTLLPILNLSIGCDTLDDYPFYTPMSTIDEKSKIFFLRIQELQKELYTKDEKKARSKSNKLASKIISELKET